MLAAMVALTPVALADPEPDVTEPDDHAAAPIEVSSLDVQDAAPNGPPIFSLPFPLAIPNGTPAGQDPTPVTGTAPFAPPTINPSSGSTVGVAMPIIITFDSPVPDQAAAEQA